MRNGILVLFNYDVARTARIKQPTDARWSKTHKGWHIADTTINASLQFWLIQHV